MSEEQELYHELETLQELGYLEDTNISEILDEFIEEEQEQDNSFEELENHMVIGEYYETNT